MKKTERMQKQSYKNFMKLLEDGDITPIGIINSYNEMQDDLSDMLIGACQAIADYTRKEDK